MRCAMTDAETKLWAILRAKRLDAYKFKRQAPIGPFIADFVCFSERLIIEADGSQHAENPADDRRTAWLEAQGFTVLRFWNADILLRPDDIATHIHKVLTNPSPRSAVPSRPLPQGEREESRPHV
jgi:very-short-patch-repair endonuclease